MCPISGPGFQGSGFMFVNNICKEVHLNLSQICLFHLFSSGPGPWGLFFLNIFWLDIPFNDGTPQFRQWTGPGFHRSCFMFVQNICKEFHNDLSQMCVFHSCSSGFGFQVLGLFLIPVWLKCPRQWSVRCPNSCWCTIYFPHHVEAKETRTLNATVLTQKRPDLAALADVRWLMVVMYHTTKILSLNPNQFNLLNNHI